MPRLFALLALLILTAASRADIGPLDPAAKPSTLIGARYVLSISVSINGTEEEELTGRFTVDLNGRLVLHVGGKPLPGIDVKGVTVSEARRRIADALKGYFVSEPEVLVGISAMPRIRVLMEGAALRLGTITLADGAKLSDLLAECGYASNADTAHIRVRRSSSDGTRSDLEVDFLSADASRPENLRDPTLRDGDRIFLPTLPLPVVQRTVVVLGEVRTPGTYRYTPDMTVRDALSAARGFTSSADRETVIIRRLHQSAILQINGQRAMDSVPTDNLKLQPDDTLYVGTKDNGRRWAVLGEVESPTTREFRRPTTLKQAIQDAGGFKPSADRRQVVLAKRMLFDPAHAEYITLNVEDILSGRAADVPLEAGDVVQVPPKRRGGFNLLDLGGLIMRFLFF
jgi:polysaccharide export outer membrane protein